MTFLNVAHFQNVLALVIGDTMLDRYLWGRVGRIPPEAPVPVVRVEGRTDRLGGAANVAANLAALGCGVRLLGAKGADASGQSPSRLLAENKIEDHLVTPAEPRPTIVKTRVVAQGQQLLRLDEEETGGIGPADSKALLDRARKLIVDVDVVILSDYGKGTTDGLLCPAIISLAAERSLPILVDPKGRDWNKYNGATCITPNTAELELVSGKRITSDETLMNAGLGILNTITV